MSVAYLDTCTLQSHFCQQPSSHPLFEITQPDRCFGFRSQKSIAGRYWPEKLRLKDLDFQNPSSRLYSIKYALASAGLFAKERGANMVTERDREKTVVIGDIGGQAAASLLDGRA